MENETGKNSTGLEWLRRMIGSMDLNSKILVISVLITFIVILLLVINYSLRPDYALLYGGLDLKDASEIIQELDTQSVKYKVSSGGRNILVPVKDRDRLRIALAGKGFLPSNTTGYELFDKNRMTLSTFEQKVDFKRAQEGELARTLMSLDEVEYARVHLVVPDPSPFLEDQSEPSASVVLKLKGTMRLDPSKTAAISNLVATAVGGMDPKNITIMDDRANLLAGGGIGDEYGLELMPNQQKYRHDFEETVKQKVKGVIEPAYGPGNVAVSVSADFDFDKIEEEKTTYEPATGSDTGIIRSHELTEKISENAPLNQGGVAGASANVPSYEGGTSSSGNNSKTSETTETKNYEVSQTQTKTTYAQGKIKKLSISVLLNAETLDAAEKTKVEGLVKAAANTNDTRGDMVTVASQVFDTTFQDEIDKARAQTASAEAKKNYLTIGLLLLTAALLGFALFKLMRPVSIPPGVIIEPDTSKREKEEIEWDRMVPDTADLARSRMRDDVLRMTKEHPQEAAKVIKSWLKE